MKELYSLGRNWWVQFKGEFMEDNLKDQIKELRNRTGLSQDKFSERFNIPASTLREWEQGKRKPPIYVLEMLKKIIDLEFKK